MMQAVARVGSSTPELAEIALLSRAEEGHRILQGRVQYSENQKKQRISARSATHIYVLLSPPN